MLAEVRSTACDGNPPFFFFCSSLSTTLLSSLRSFLSFRSFLLVPLSDSRLAFAFSRLGPPQALYHHFPRSPRPVVCNSLTSASLVTPAHPSQTLLLFSLRTLHDLPVWTCSTTFTLSQPASTTSPPVMPFFHPPAFSDIDDSLNPQIPLCPLSRAHLSQT